MKGILLYSLPLIVLWSGTVSCKKPQAVEEEAPERVILAEVFDYKLYYDDIKDLIQGFTDKEDSMQQVRSLTEHWVRDRFLLVEAEKNFPKEANMSKLLEDYRQSLLRHFFEQRVMEERLDTIITEDDLNAYYEVYSDQHRLESGIIRGYFIKLNKPLGKGDKILQWWKSFPGQHRSEVLSYAAAHAVDQWTDTMDWHELPRVLQLFPGGTLSASVVRSKRGIVKEDRDYFYLLYPLEVYHAQEIAPLSSIRQQAARFILHQRELELLETIKEEIYNRDIQNDRVKIYIE